MIHEKKYCSDFEPPYTPMLVIQEASRCLLCHDAPCSKACPANTEPDRFIRSVYFRNFKGAAEIIRENNALGAVCARVCPTEKLCQKGCSRSGIDKPIDIGKIQRFVTDFETQTKMNILPKGKKNKGKIAIIGSGPSGLQASVSLTNLGYDVTVYEKNPQLGGWLRYGIPEYRLSDEVLDKEIEHITQMGISFKTGIEIGKSLTIEELKKQYRAVLVAVGASYGRTLPLFDNAKHVELASVLLAKIKSAKGKNIDIPKSALIIGGGDVAMDISTSLKLLGCADVTCVAREQLHEFPASKNEFAHAQSVNVSIIDGFTPVGIQDHCVTFQHVKHEKSQLQFTADKIILAIGQKSDLSPFAAVKQQTGIIETHNYQTSDPQIFASGDIVKGDKTVVFAVKTGKEAAQAIDNYLGGK